MQGVIGIEDVHGKILYQIADCRGIDRFLKRNVRKTIFGTVEIHADIVCLKILLYARQCRFTGFVIAADLKFSEITDTVYAAVLRDNRAVRAYHLAEEGHCADRVAACQNHGNAVIDKSS